MIKGVYDMTMPLVTQALFVPVFGVLMKLFVCIETIGDELDDAFLEIDCY
jgi:hypothetical protein